MQQIAQITLEPFRHEDVKTLTPIMKRAFDEDARRHLGEPEGGPDGYDNGDFLRKYALHPGSAAYVIRQGETPIGCVILWIRGRENFLGCLFVDTVCQDQGIGLTVWNRVETMYPQTRMWRTETPGFSRRNHHFYVNKCGFHIVRIDDHANPKACQYQMEKVMPTPR